MTWLSCAVIGGVLCTLIVLRRGEAVKAAVGFDDAKLFRGLAKSMLLGGATLGTIFWLLVVLVT